MKVFLSWSGDASKELAKALKGWLPLVLQHVEPWMSTEDIPKGERWLANIEEALGECRFGILCVTRANQGEPWLNFEAGALARAVGASGEERKRVAPLVLGITPTDLTGPLQGFNAVRAEADDIRRLLRDINSVSDRPLDPEVMDASFEIFWPKLEASIGGIPIDTPTTPHRTTRPVAELLDELVDRTRSVERGLAEVQRSQERSNPSERSRLSSTSVSKQRSEHAERALLRIVRILDEANASVFDWRVTERWATLIARRVPRGALGDVAEAMKDSPWETLDIVDRDGVGVRLSPGGSWRDVALDRGADF